jgi:hypothetical protein
MHRGRDSRHDSRRGDRNHDHDRDRYHY